MVRFKFKVWFKVKDIIMVSVKVRFWFRIRDKLRFVLGFGIGLG